MGEACLQPNSNISCIWEGGSFIFLDQAYTKETARLQFSLIHIFFHYPQQNGYVRDMATADDIGNLARNIR